MDVYPCTAYENGSLRCATRSTGPLMQDNPFHDVLLGRSLPAAWVDLDAFNRNMTRVASYATRAGKSVRLASKSVRHIGLMKRVLNHESGVFQGSSALLWTRLRGCINRDSMISLSRIQV